MAKMKSIAELSRALASQQKRVLKLQSQRSRLLDDLRVVDKQISALTGQPVAAATTGKQSAPRRNLGKSANRKSLPLCLMELLTAAPEGKMRAMHMADAVVEAGYDTRDKNFKNTVAKTLAKDERFKRVGRGMYTLSAAGKK